LQEAAKRSWELARNAKEEVFAMVATANAFRRQEIQILEEKVKKLGEATRLLLLLLILVILLFTALVGLVLLCCSSA